MIEDNLILFDMNYSMIVMISASLGNALMFFQFEPRLIVIQTVRSQKYM